MYLTSVIQLITYIIYRDNYKSFNKYRLSEKCYSDDEIDIELG